MKITGAFLILSFILAIGAFAQNKKTEVLFVCEHGSAKSVVAATHFAKIARENGLDVKVISKGTNPDAEIPGKVNQFLIDDGFPKPTMKPQKLTDDDLLAANYVVMFCPLPSNYNRPARIETWNIPSFESSYTTARDSIVNNVERLIVRIKSDLNNR